MTSILYESYDYMDYLNRETEVINSIEYDQEINELPDRLDIVGYEDRISSNTNFTAEAMDLATALSKYMEMPNPDGGRFYMPADELKGFVLLRK
jgi:hypothetical protein